MTKPYLTSNAVMGILMIFLCLFLGFFCLIVFFNETFLDKLQNPRDRSEFVSLGVEKIFVSPESYEYACMCIDPLLAFKQKSC